MRSRGWDYKTTPENFNKFYQKKSSKDKVPLLFSTKCPVRERVKHFLLTAKPRVRAGLGDLNEWLR